MINIFYIIKTIKIIYIYNILNIVNKNIILIINNNIQFTFGYRFMDKICA